MCIRDRLNHDCGNKCPHQKAGWRAPFSRNLARKPNFIGFSNLRKLSEEVACYQYIRLVPTYHCGSRPRRLYMQSGSSRERCPAPAFKLRPRPCRAEQRRFVPSKTAVRVRPAPAPSPDPTQKGSILRPLPRCPRRTPALSCSSPTIPTPCMFATSTPCKSSR